VLLELQGVYSFFVVKTTTERIEQAVLLSQIHHVMLCDFDAFLGKEPYLLLELLTFVVVKVQPFQQSLLNLVNVIVVRVGGDFAGQFGGSIGVELDRDLPGIVIGRMAEQFICFHCLFIISCLLFCDRAPSNSISGRYTA